MDHRGSYPRLNLQEHWCQNIWKSLLIIGPKTRASPHTPFYEIITGIVLGGQVMATIQSRSSNLRVKSFKLWCVDLFFHLSLAVLLAELAPQYLAGGGLGKLFANKDYRGWPLEAG
jgi:hypothetical protein